MEVAALFFMTSGLFLGWSLGANDAANVFGTAVGTRMIRFTTAAVICSVFVVLGAVVSGAGATGTLGKLGSVNALPGSFMAALAAALSVYVMTKSGLPVSTTQAIVGAIVGWNLFTETETDTGALVKILSTWIASPILAAIFAVILFKLLTFVLRTTKLHLLRIDAYTRLGLVLAGAFGAYSLGANNIANVVGVFVHATPFTDLNVAGLFTVTAVEQLFLLGGLAIAFGVLTYSERVMRTVGEGLLPLSPSAAWVVVVAHSLVLFLFASQGLERFLAGQGLPTIPLVPVSSSQAVVGAVLGIGLLKGARAVRWRVLGSIVTGWVMTPVFAAVVCFFGLFFLQNVFGQKVYREVSYVVSPPAIERLEQLGMSSKALGELANRRFETAVRFRRALEARADLSADERRLIMEYAEINPMTIDPERFPTLARGGLSPAQSEAVRALAGRTFTHKWMLAETLARASPEWRFLADEPLNRSRNRKLQGRLDFVFRTFRVD